MEESKPKKRGRKSKEEAIAALTEKDRINMKVMHNEGKSDEEIGKAFKITAEQAGFFRRFGRMKLKK